MGAHRELPCWLRPRQRRGPFGSRPENPTGLLRNSDGVLKSAVPSRSSDGSSSRAALLAATKAASWPFRIETGESDRVVAQLGWCTEERRTEPEFRWELIASCLIGCAQGSVVAPRIESWMILQVVAGSDGVLKSAVPSRSPDGRASRAALLAAPKAAFEAPQIETWTMHRLDVLVRRVPARMPEYANGHFTDGRGRTTVG